MEETEYKKLPITKANKVFYSKIPWIIFNLIIYNFQRHRIQSSAIAKNATNRQKLQKARITQNKSVPHAIQICLSVVPNVSNSMTSTAVSSITYAANVLQTRRSSVPSVFTPLLSEIRCESTSGDSTIIQDPMLQLIRINRRSTNAKIAERATSMRGLSRDMEDSAVKRILGRSSARLAKRHIKITTVWESISGNIAAAGKVFNVIIARIIPEAG